MTARNWRALPAEHPFREHCARIAKHLPGYTLGRHGSGLALRSAPWKTILIGLTRDQKRLVFRGVYPYPEPRPSYWQSGAEAIITAAITKPEATIAAEIQRRLLPKYTDELTDVRQRILDYERGLAARQQLIDTVLHRLPGSWLVEPSPPHKSFIRASRWDNPHISNIEIHPADDGTTTDITITGAARPLLDMVVNSAAAALQAQPTSMGSDEQGAASNLTPLHYLEAIVAILNHPGYWSPNTLDDIAEVITAAGYPILDNAEGRDDQ